jgi:hypothetical protein
MMFLQKIVYLPISFVRPISNVEVPVPVGE